MKVTGIKSYAFADDEGKLYFIAKVETDEGIYGLGEVGIPRWGMPSPARLSTCRNWLSGRTRSARSGCGSTCFAAASFRRTRSIAAR